MRATQFRYASQPFENLRVVQQLPIVRVPLVFITPETQFIAPHMRREAHVIITRPEVVAPGLRLGDWPQVDEGEPADPYVEYACSICGSPIAAADGDDNGGWCDECAKVQS